VPLTATQLHVDIILPEHFRASCNHDMPAGLACAPLTHGPELGKRQKACVARLATPVKRDPSSLSS
jgi:hypothetical protein